MSRVRCMCQQAGHRQGINKGKAVRGSTSITAMHPKILLHPSSSDPPTNLGFGVMPLAKGQQAGRSRQVGEREFVCGFDCGSVGQ